MLTWLMARLVEPTTWIGLSTILTAAGVALAPELKEAIVSTGVAVGGLLAILLKEKAS